MDINVISYIIHISTSSLTLNKWLFRKGYSVALITSDLNADERAEIVQAFSDDQPLKNSTKSPDILIGTTTLIGQGFTLTRAFRLVIMGPEWLATDEEQCVGRIRRLGQKNKCTISYCLIEKGVKVEEGILNRHALRKEFEGMALELQNELKKNLIVLSDDEV